MKTIGIPNASRIRYYKTLYKVFFETLGFKVVISPETDKRIVDLGVHNSETDFCFAIKIFVGHVLDLKDKCDYVFIPSLAGENPYYCQYHVSLPNIISTLFPKIKVLTAEIKQNGERLERIARKLGKSDKEIGMALKKGQEAWKQEKLEQIRKEELKFKDKRRKIAIIGPENYITKDKFCLMNIPDLLEKENIVPVFFNPSKYKEHYNPGYRYNWIIEQEVMTELIDAIKDKRIDGIVFISPFSCGPLFLIHEEIILKHPEKKFLVLNVDESQNETRIKTRIEAFLDILK
ncbi:MAG: hypothetical protein JSW08_01405 [archaeon]|nr:MAG: hypothetical protein JSW08_01405 [archaeon]